MTDREANVTSVKSSPQLDRRTFIRRVVLYAVGFGATQAVLAACTSAPAAPTTAPKADAKPTTGSVAAPSLGGGAPTPTAGASGAAVAQPTAAPAVKPGGPAGGRLVVSVPSWSSETPLAWKSAVTEKALWDVIYDPLIMRDLKTFEYRPGLATEWAPSNDFKTWTFKLRQGVMFHEDWGEFTAEDVKWTVEQNLRPEANSNDSGFYKQDLDRIETPDKYTVVMHLKSPNWSVPTHYTKFLGVQSVTSKKYVTTVGEEKAALHPIGTGPYRHVEGRQGEQHRFEAVPNHWRIVPHYNELVIRLIKDGPTRVAGVRSGELDVGAVTGDLLDAARKAGLRIHEQPGTVQQWIALPGKTLPGLPDYNPAFPWVGDPDDPKAQENARKVRMALSLAINKQAIVDGLWQGAGSTEPFSPWYYPSHKGFSKDWKILPYDLARAKQLLAEAGHAGGFEIKLAGMVSPVATDGPDLADAVALDWEKLGVKVVRSTEDFATWVPKIRARKTGGVAWPYGSQMNDEPALNWRNTTWSKGSFLMYGESAEQDKLIEAILAEMDAEKRARLSAEYGQLLYDQMYVAQIGWKSSTWAVSKKVGYWPTFTNPHETFVEYILPPTS